MIVLPKMSITTIITTGQNQAFCVIEVRLLIELAPPAPITTLPVPTEVVVPVKDVTVVAGCLPNIEVTTPPAVAIKLFQLNPEVVDVGVIVVAIPAAELTASNTLIIISSSFF